MSVNTQVSGKKELNIQPSKNMGTVINTQVSGEKINATHEYRKLTDVQPTQVSGEVHNTNYMGINDEGMDIRAAKKISDDELNIQSHPTFYEGKNSIIATANALIAAQEADKKEKNHPVVEETTTPDEPVTPEEPEEGGDDTPTEGEGGEDEGGELL